MQEAQIERKRNQITYLKLVVERQILIFMNSRYHSFDDYTPIYVPKKNQVYFMGRGFTFVWLDVLPFFSGSVGKLDIYN